MTDVFVPRETVSDTHCRLVAIHVRRGQHVTAGAALFEFESSKSTFDVSADTDGTVEWEALEIGEFYPVGGVIARLVVAGENDVMTPRVSDAPKSSAKLTILSDAAMSLSTDNSSVGDGERRFVRTTDLSTPASRTDMDCALAQSPDSSFQKNLDRELEWRRTHVQRTFNRHVPTGTALNDRWTLARTLGFGEGSSIYDEALVLGRVDVGRHCWIGPFVVLDGFHASLSIGDYTSIGSGSQIYTHDTIARVLTGNDSVCHAAPTRIGKHCFVAPQVIIGPGTVIGDHCLITGGSVVQGTFPDYSVIQGNPALRTGSVRISNSGFHVEREA